MPLVNPMRVEVALAAVAPKVVGVHGKMPMQEPFFAKHPAVILNPEP